MKDRQVPVEYQSIEEHIRRAHIQRSVAVASLLANVADALWNGVARFSRAVLGSLSAARDARTVEADALLNRIVIR